MVASNKLTELRIVTEATQSLLPGKDNGQEQMADRDWYWWLEKKPTEVAQFLRVEINVAREEQLRDRPLYTLVAFLSSDLKADAETEPERELVPGTPPKEADNARN